MEADGIAGSGRAWCAICQSPLESEGAVTDCPSCRARYHADCWRENGGCAVYGCTEVPPVEKLGSLEIPVSFWGQEEKPCPACGQTILAAALRCRHCGATFGTARPVGQSDFQARTSFQHRMPALKRTIVWLFVLSILPCTAPFAAIVGGIWYARHKPDVRALPALYWGVCRFGIVVGAGQTALSLVMAMLYMAFRT